MTFVGYCNDTGSPSRRVAFACYPEQILGSVHQGHWPHWPHYETKHPVLCALSLRARRPAKRFTYREEMPDDREEAEGRDKTFVGTSLQGGWENDNGGCWFNRISARPLSLSLQDKQNLSLNLPALPPTLYTHEERERERERERVDPWLMNESIN